MPVLCKTLAEIITVIGVLIILLGVIKALFEFRKIEFQKIGLDQKAIELDRLRNDMGAYLLLGLEFSVAADIIFTVLEPSHDALIVLVVLVAIRTVISYFVGKERESIHRELREAASTP